MTEHNYQEKITECNGCWLWTASLDEKGYGRAWYKGRQYKAHRAIYEIFHGKVEAGLELDHLCRTRACVNPAHLEPVTHAVNVQRGKSGLFAKSKTHCVNGHKYTPENTYFRPGSLQGLRDCKMCRRIRTRAWKKKALEGLA